MLDLANVAQAADSLPYPLQRSTLALLRALSGRSFVARHLLRDQRGLQRREPMVAQGPTWTGTSTSNPPSGKAMEAGAEITDNVAHAVGHINMLYRLDTSYDTITGWSGATIPTPSPIVTSISWVSPAQRDLTWSTGSCS
jgi:hypothetical protein